MMIPYCARIQISSHFAFTAKENTRFENATAPIKLWANIYVGNLNVDCVDLWHIDMSIIPESFRPRSSVVLQHPLDRDWVMNPGLKTIDDCLDSVAHEVAVTRRKTVGRRFSTPSKADGSICPPGAIEGLLVDASRSEEVVNINILTAFEYDTRIRNS